MDYYLAVDIGASSGRHIVGWKEGPPRRAGNEIITQEVYRFPNDFTKSGDSLTWDLASIVSHVKKGIDEALKVFPSIKSLSVNTWGVDYVLMNGDEEIFNH